MVMFKSDEIELFVMIMLKTDHDSGELLFHFPLL